MNHTESWARISLWRRDLRCRMPVRGGNVKESCISFVKLKRPVEFRHPCNDPVKIVFTLGGVSDNGHIELLQELSSLLAADNMIDRLSDTDTYEELIKLIEKEAEK